MTQRQSGVELAGFLPRLKDDETPKATGTGGWLGGVYGVSHIIKHKIRYND